MDGPTIGSLCSGYGGLDIAVLAVFGGRVVWHAETDPHAARILAHHRPGVPNHGDITACDWARVKPVDILTCGWPCQPWSDAGPRRGAADTRDLWPAVAVAMRVLRPRLLVAENVVGFARAGLARTLADLAGLGYDTRWCRLPAAAAGAPHLRWRWFAVAWSDADADGERLPQWPQPHVRPAAG